jgi:hypothetical protein
MPVFGRRGFGVHVLGHYTRWDTMRRQWMRLHFEGHMTVLIWHSE